MSSAVEAIQAANYAATEQQVEALAYSVADGIRADGTYLRVLIAHVQAQIGAPRKRARGGDDASQLAVLETIHTRLYAAVLRGVGATDMPADERKRRATFARSAASTIRAFVKAGGDVRTVDVKDTSKGKLRRVASKAAIGAHRAEQDFNKARRALERAAARLCRQQPADAEKLLGEAMDSLDKLLESVQEPGATSVILPAPRVDMQQPGAQLHAPS